MLSHNSFALIVCLHHHASTLTHCMHACVYVLQVLASLQRFRDLGKIHRVALEVVARSLEQGQIDSLKVTATRITAMCITEQSCIQHCVWWCFVCNSFVMNTALIALARCNILPAQSSLPMHGSAVVNYCML
jgi:hypothetical protein